MAVEVRAAGSRSVKDLKDRNTAGSINRGHEDRLIGYELSVERRGVVVFYSAEGAMAWAPVGHLARAFKLDFPVYGVVEPNLRFLLGKPWAEAIEDLRKMSP